MTTSNPPVDNKFPSPDLPSQPAVDESFLAPEWLENLVNQAFQADGITPSPHGTSVQPESVTPARNPIGATELFPASGMLYPSLPIPGSSFSAPLVHDVPNLSQGAILNAPRSGSPEPTTIVPARNPVAPPLDTLTTLPSAGSSQPNLFGMYGLGIPELNTPSPNASSQSPTTTNEISSGTLSETISLHQLHRYYFLPEEETAAPPSDDPIDMQGIRGDFPFLNQKINGKPLAWLDNAATSQKPLAVIEALRNYYLTTNSNVHRGAHTLAARATEAYESAREKVQRFIGAASHKEIIFLRGATEAINLVAQTYGRKFLEPDDEVIVSTLEHHSNIVPWQFLREEKGIKLRVIPIDDNGELKLDEYAKLLNPRTKLVAITQVSNALGTVNPVEEIIHLAHAAGAKVLIDGAQSVPHFRVNVLAMDADFFVFSGHKVFAPTGIGVLYGKEALLNDMPPWQGGGSMIDKVTFDHTTFNGIPYKFEAGTPIIGGAVGLGAAIDYLNKIGFENATRYENQLMTYAISQLSAISGLRIIGNPMHRAGSISFILEGIPSENIGKFLDGEGIAVRSGHHCAQPALRHFGLESSVRPSLAIYNMYNDIDRLVEALIKAGRKLK